MLTRLLYIYSKYIEDENFLTFFFVNSFYLRTCLSKYTGVKEEYEEKKIIKSLYLLGKGENWKQKKNLKKKLP